MCRFSRVPSGTPEVLKSLSMFAVKDNWGPAPVIDEGVTQHPPKQQLPFPVAKLDLI